MWVKTSHLINSTEVFASKQILLWQRHQSRHFDQNHRINYVWKTNKHYVCRTNLCWFILSLARIWWQRHPSDHKTITFSLKYRWAKNYRYDTQAPNKTKKIIKILWLLIYKNTIPKDTLQTDKNWTVWK